MDWSPPSSYVQGILQARILEWVAISSPRRSSPPRDWTHISSVSWIAGRSFTCWATGEDPFQPYDSRHFCLLWSPLCPWSWSSAWFHQFPMNEEGNKGVISVYPRVSSRRPVVGGGGITDACFSEGEERSRGTYWVWDRDVAGAFSSVSGVQLSYSWHLLSLRAGTMPSSVSVGPGIPEVLWN